VPKVFLDVVEKVNLLVNTNGTVVRSEIAGALKMRVFLSGMPECKLGLNDKVQPPPAAATLLRERVSHDPIRFPKLEMFSMSLGYPYILYPSRV
jgi:AP-1 complex subunit mu